MQIKSRAVAGAVHGLGEDHFPAQAEGDGQLRSGAPFILPVPEEAALLAFLGVGAGADVAVEVGHVAQQEGGKTIPGDWRFWPADGNVAGDAAVEGEFAGAVAVARHAEIFARNGGRRRTLKLWLAGRLGDVVDRTGTGVRSGSAGSCTG